MKTEFWNVHRLDNRTDNIENEFITVYHKKSKTGKTFNYSNFKDYTENDLCLNFPNVEINELVELDNSILLYFNDIYFEYLGDDLK